MSNSSLVTYKHICKHYDKGREGKKISKIFVHHMAGNLTVKQCGNVFDNRQASAHYGVNGKAIGLYVNECDTAWHCGNWGYNTKSIGIELANDGGANWHVSDTTIDTAIRLIADICKRNGIKKLNYTGDMSGNLCMHKWVCSTSCPGTYLATKFKYIAAQVNKILGNGEVINPISLSPFGQLEEDGIGGPDTVGCTQRFLGTTIDCYVSGQNEDYREYYEAFRDDVIAYDDDESETVKHIQWLVGVYEDGELGPVTAKGVQKLVGVEQDGYWGPITMKAWQHYLNTHEKAVYPATHAPDPAAKKETAKKATSASTTKKTTSTTKKTSSSKTKTVKIGQACSDENGKVVGGKAGDQTGNEVAISTYTYSSSSSSPYHWQGVYRAKDEGARKKIADACIKACKNKHVGYDQGKSDRKSLYKEAKKKNWQIDKITTNCETTCSELANVCVAAAGLPHLGTDKQANVGTLPEKLMSSKKFSRIKLDKSKLQPGDILVSGCHTAIVVSVK